MLDVVPVPLNRTTLHRATGRMQMTAFGISSRDWLFKSLFMFNSACVWITTLFSICCATSTTLVLSLKQGNAIFWFHGMDYSDKINSTFFVTYTMTDRININLSACQDLDIHSITGLVKFFLRQLPDSLITQEAMEEFTQAGWYPYILFVQLKFFFKEEYVVLPEPWSILNFRSMMQV